MTMLSKEQQTEVDCGRRPVKAQHPVTGEVFVMVPAEVFQRLGSLLDDNEFQVSDTYAAQDAALAKVWDDPELDEYSTLVEDNPR